MTFSTHYNISELEKEYLMRKNASGFHWRPPLHGLLAKFKTLPDVIFNLLSTEIESEMYKLNKVITTVISLPDKCL